MSEASIRFGFPFLSAGQSQKELFHNEAIAGIDRLLHPVVEGAGVDTPPSSPAEGQCWIVGSAPTGGWTGHAEAIAQWSEAGWAFVAPRDGMTLWSLSDQVWIYRNSGNWLVGTLQVSRLMIGSEQVVGPRQSAIPEPFGGTLIDEEARSALGLVLAALRSHGLISA